MGSTVFQGNPIWFSDILGDSIDIEGSNGITHRYIPGESYEGEDSFIKNTVKELERLESSGKTGKKLVQDVSDSEQIVTIRKGSDYKASGREITITGSKIRIPVQNRSGTESVEHSEVFILLGHELAHTWDNINKITANDPSLTDLDGYPAEERYALHIENKIRAESGMNLRTHYKVQRGEEQIDMGDGRITTNVVYKGVGTRIINEKGESIMYTKPVLTFDMNKTLITGKSQYRIQNIPVKYYEDR